MDKDIYLKHYLFRNDRYADLLNGYGFGGKQVISPADLTETDSQTLLKFWITKLDKRIPKQGIRYRDLVRKAAFGVNFVVIGIENQNEVDYLMPLRVMAYDLGEYQKQASAEKQNIRKRKGTSKSEFLSGFGKDSLLKPCITIVIYYGKKWDGARSLLDVLDFTDIPENLKHMTGNYKINLLEIRKIADTSVFKTDLKQVFDFMKYAEDKCRLKKLVTEDAAYRAIDEEAFDVLANFTKAKELLQVKEYYEEGGKIDMCQALTEMLADERQEGMREGGIQALILDNLEEGIAKECIIRKLEKRFSLTKEQAQNYLVQYEN